MHLNEKISKVNRAFYLNRDALELQEAREVVKGEFENEEDHVFIYLPSYNRASFLAERSVPSVLRQSHRNFTLLIVGDCCNDESGLVASSTGDPRVFFINLPFRSYIFPDTAENRWYDGAVRASNIALMNVPKYAKWIARIDDDEVWREDHLAQSITFAKSRNCEFVSSGNIENYKQKQTVENMGLYVRSPYFYPEISKTDVRSPMLGCVSTWVYRSYLCRFQFNVDSWRSSHNRPHDLDFALRLYEAGVEIGHTQKIGVTTTPREDDDLIGISAYLATGNPPGKNK